MPFPPVPAYPTAIDSDYTLFLVYNTTEARLCVDNAPWAEEIQIVPVDADRPEIWADNGFGNIEGEMFYYDSVSKDDNGKVYKLRGCARNLSGKQTKFNKKGVWVRGFVVATHHNQIVDSILQTENFIGYNFDPRTETLDWRIRNLRELNVIFDDFSCPDVNFTWIITEDDPETGVLASYTTEITPPGSITNFRLDFGDGQFTTTDLNGEHRFALNARVDPVVTVSNDRCQMIQTPVLRENPAEPVIETTDAFSLVIQDSPDVPDFTVVPCEVAEPQINIPPTVFPCGISIEGQIGPIPSVIVGPDINMVSVVTIIGGPIEIPSIVTIEGGFDLPSLISIAVPPTIVIDPPIPPTIVIIGQSNITMQMDFSEMPRVEVDWGTPPPMEVTVTMARQVKTPEMFAADPKVKNEFGEEFADLFQASQQFKVEYETANIPNEIRLIVPDIADVKLDASDLPRTIKIDTSEMKLPEFIRLLGPEEPLPEHITIGWGEGQQPIADRIEVFNRDVPTKIEAVNVGIPEKITVEMARAIPEKIMVEMMTPIPDRIIVDATETMRELRELWSQGITIKVPEDAFRLLPPRAEDMPPVKMVYDGGPIEMKLSFADLKPSDEEGKYPCVMMVPCNR
jgi:hypothetical protein